jgi:hypothetical protein
MRAGLMPERVKRVWSAVKCDVISFGVVGGGESGKSDCKGVVVGPPRPFANVFRIDCWKLLDGVTTADGKGEGDSNEGNGGLGFEGVTGGFFFVANGRNIDHSDSNCTESNSERSGVCSKSAASRSSSIFFSALRMMKTIVLD